MITPALADAKKRMQQIMDQWASMKQERSPWEQIYRDVGDYLIPRRNTDALEVPGALFPRRVVDNTGVVAADRLASTLHGHLLSPFEPFVAPRLDDGEPSYEEAVWFDAVTRIKYRHLSGSGSTFRVQLAEGLVDSVTMGTTVIWVGGNGNRGPSFVGVPIMNCWIADDYETGLVNTLYRKFKLPLWRAAQRFPNSVAIRDKINKPNADRREMLMFLHCVEPREAGRPGDFAHNKPFADATLLIEPNEIVDASGWDEFPYSVSRFQRLSGQPYGYSPGMQALPLIKGLNVLLDSVIRTAEFQADPTLIDLTGGAYDNFDRRPGSMISIDPSLYRSYGDQPFRPLIEAGDVRPANQVIADLRSQIQFTMYIDWMQLRENATMTATEVIDRRDTRLRTMSPVVARLEQELLNPIAERTFSLMQRAGMFPDPPESLVGRDLSFEYTSPIAQAQRASSVESIVKTLELAAGVAQIDPSAIENLKTGEMLRKGARDNGLPERLLEDPEIIAANRAAAQQQAQLEAALGQANVAAGALQQGAQGAASLAQIGG